MHQNPINDISSFVINILLTPYKIFTLSSNNLLHTHFLPDKELVREKKMKNDRGTNICSTNNKKYLGFIPIQFLLICVGLVCL